MSRRTRVAGISAAVAAGAYRVPADDVAAAILRFFARPGDEAQTG